MCIVGHVCIHDCILLYIHDYTRIWCLFAVFGIRSHKVSLELLKYGELAANSRNKGQLLGEGIQNIVNIYKLYQPLPVQQ